ncbi:hypothetical protein K6U06_03535 [Acidiferrimicrobium sp. IK]|nr:hypothetical protein [Acidiferrimicrobium sp. IK]
MPEKRTHDYLRHGTTSLFAAFNTSDGSVISSLHRRHRPIEFKKFLAKIDATVPDGLDIHIRAWIAAWNDNPKPFIWTKTADQILEELGRLLQRINGGGC